MRNPNYIVGMDITDNECRSVYYTDAEFTYELGRCSAATASAFLNVTNAFDKDPPPTNVHQSPGPGSIPPKYGLYDVLGRRYTMGVRFKL